MTTAWLKDVIGYGTHAARPAAGSEGVLYYETDTETLFRDNGSSWDTLTIAPEVTPPWTLISKQRLASTAAEVTFSGIAQTYTHLQIVAVTRTDGAATGANDLVYVRLNGDTGANYDTSIDQAQSTSSTGGVAIAEEPGSGQAAGVFGAFAALVFDYAATDKWKLVSGLNLASFGSTNSYEENRGGVWRDTAAVTTLAVVPAIGNFVVGSVVSLYGIA